MTARVKVLTEQIVVRMAPELMRAVERDAVANERRPSQTIRLAVQRYLGITKLSGAAQHPDRSGEASAADAPRTAPREGAERPF